MNYCTSKVPIVERAARHGIGENHATVFDNIGGIRLDDWEVASAAGRS